MAQNLLPEMDSLTLNPDRGPKANKSTAFGGADVVHPCPRKSGLGQLQCGGPARQPSIHNLLQIADVDSSVIRWVNADLVTHILPS